MKTGFYQFSAKSLQGKEIKKELIKPDFKFCHQPAKMNLS